MKSPLVKKSWFIWLFGTLFLVFLFFSYAFPVLAQSPFEDDFNDYTAEHYLNGQGNWTGYNTWKINDLGRVYLPVGGNGDNWKAGELKTEGSWRLSVNITGCPYAYSYFNASFSTSSSGSWSGDYFYWGIGKKDDECWLSTIEGGTSTTTYLSKISPNEWHTIDVQWSLNSLKFRVRVDEEDWSEWLSVSSPEYFKGINAIRIKSRIDLAEFDDLEHIPISGTGGYPDVEPTYPEDEKWNYISTTTDISFSGEIVVPELYNGYCFNLWIFLNDRWSATTTQKTQLIIPFDEDFMVKTSDILPYSTTTDIEIVPNLMKVSYILHCFNFDKNELELFEHDENATLSIYPLAINLPSPPLSEYITELPEPEEYFENCEGLTTFDWLFCKLKNLFVEIILPTPVKKQELENEITKISTKFPVNYLSESFLFISDISSGITETEPDLVITAPFTNTTSSIDFSLVKLNLGGTLNLTLQSIIKTFFSVLLIFLFIKWLLGFLGDIF